MPLHVVHHFRWVSLILTLALASAAPAAGPYFVKADATGAHNGSSWTDAYTSLQSALAVAKSGEEIWVAAGTYKPTTGTDRNATFMLVAGAALYGGFAGGESTRDQRDWQTHETILSGDIGTQGSSADNSYHVVGGANQAVLDGFTVTGGNAQLSNQGGGMFNNQATSVTVANCSFRGNSATYGGAMYNLQGSVTITHCTFIGNGAVYGAGIYHRGMSYYPGAIVSHCAFIDNNGSKGGGIYDYMGAPKVTNCIFSTQLSGDGSGIYSDGSMAVVTNCIFIRTKNVGVGSMYNYNPTSPRVTNCIFWGETYAEIYNQGGTPRLSHCDIRGSGGSGASWASWLGTDGGGNIAADPRFVNPAQPAGPDGIWMTADDGYQLRADSPCINAGDPDGAPPTDILNQPRKGLPDIGAYECLLNRVMIWAIYD